MIFATALYLFTTHMTQKKTIAFAALAIVLVVAAIAWFLRRRRSRA